jgi:hypothetical protein
MISKLSYDFCNIDIYENYIIVVIFEGINIIPEHNNVLLSIAEKYFKNKSFGYNTNRINSNSVDPRIYLETSRIKNLAAFAIVSSKKIHKSNAAIEKLFFKKPFKHFAELDVAINWINKKVSKYQ